MILTTFAMEMTVIKLVSDTSYNILIGVHLFMYRINVGTNGKTVRVVKCCSARKFDIIKNFKRQCDYHLLRCVLSEMRLLKVSFSQVH